MENTYPDDVKRLQALLLDQTKRNERLEQLIEKLQFQVESLLRKLYGKRSEKQCVSESNISVKAACAPSQERWRSQSNTGIRTPRSYSPHLARERILHDCPESALGCCCGRKLRRIGEEKTEQLDFRPGRLFVKEHIRIKYACCCGLSGVKIAPLPAQPIEKGIPGAGLLAEVLVSKYQDALPLYRQEQRFKRYGDFLSRSTLCDWVKQSSFLLKPIVEKMKEDLLMAFNIFTDDTSIPVQNKGKTKKGRLWPYVTNGLSSPKITVYDYTPTRSQTAPKRFLGEHSGYLQADAYPGYDQLYQTQKIKEVGCMAHARRKYVDVKEAVKSDTLADDAIQYIAQLYEIERHTKHFSFQERYFYRKRYAKPILKRFYQWVYQHLKKTLPGTPIQYTKNNWRALQNYLSDGRLEMDNNRSERAIKPVVIGRKNWIFAGSHEGGKRAAIIYSIIETCKQNEVNTFQYLKWVLSKIPIHPNRKIKELLPYHFANA